MTPAVTDEGRDWGAYNAAQKARPVRPLAARVCEVMGPGDDRVLVELGAGIGREAEFFARNHFAVHAVEQDPASWPALDDLASAQNVTVHRQNLEEPGFDVPECDVVFASASLPFLSAGAFERTWRGIAQSLRPGGLLAVDLFGVRDDWAGGHGTFLARDQVEERLDGYDVLDLNESERDGPAFSGPKHWHTFQILARRTPHAAAR